LALNFFLVEAREARGKPEEVRTPNYLGDQKESQRISFSSGQRSLPTLSSGIASQERWLSWLLSFPKKGGCPGFSRQKELAVVVR